MNVGGVVCYAASPDFQLTLEMRCAKCRERCSMCGLLVCVNLMQVTVIGDQGASVEEMLPETQLSGIFANHDQRERIQPMRSSALARMVVLCSIRKHTEQARGNKPVSSILQTSASALASRLQPCFSYCSDFLQ